MNKKEVEDFSVAKSYDEIIAKNYSLAAGQYFDIKIEYVDITPEEFQAKIDDFEKEYRALTAKGAELDKQILENLRRLKIE